MKVFLAIDIPEEVQALISREVLQIQRDYPEFSWAPEKNYHITIQYIGEADEARVSQMIPIIEELTYDIEPFELYASAADVLISDRITLYMAFQKNNNLETIVKRMQDSLGLSPKYRYMPHVTVGRYKIPSKQQYLLLRKKLQQLRPEVTVPVTRVYLYKTVPARPFPEYVSLHEFPLAQPIG